MSETIICSAKYAKKLLEHMNDNDIILLSVLNRKNYIHSVTKMIKKRNGENLIDRADSIEYQDNEIFGRISLYGVVKEKDIIHNLLFHQLE